MRRLRQIKLSLTYSLARICKRALMAATMKIDIHYRKDSWHLAKDKGQAGIGEFPHVFYDVRREWSVAGRIGPVPRWRCSRRCAPLMLVRRHACDFLTEAKRRTLLHAGTRTASSFPGRREQSLQDNSNRFDVARTAIASFHYAGAA
jgi:hypothetical protein